MGLFQAKGETQICGWEKLHKREKQQGGWCDGRNEPFRVRHGGQSVAQSRRVLQSRANKLDFILSDTEQLENRFEQGAP